jgi:CHAD domain-containing protein
MGSISDESYKMYGAKVLLKRLQNLTKEIEGVCEAKDIECVHRMRVSSRRIRSALRLFNKCFSHKDVKSLEKEIRRVTKALGVARDLDVQIDFLKRFLGNLTEGIYKPGIQRLLLRLKQRREDMQKDVIKTMDRLKSSSIIDDMSGNLRQTLVNARLHNTEEYSPYVYHESYMAISLRLEEMLAYEIYVNQPESLEELHAMRIAAKRLRYTMEIFETIYSDNLKTSLRTAREIQTILGDFHDCDVWVNYLPLFLEEERIRTLEYFGHTRAFNRLKSGILYLQQERLEKREKLYKDFLKFWQTTQEQNTWDNLIEQIRQPISEMGIYTKIT